MRWDVFCRVIDNYGDLGVCRRLAADLQRHGQSVRLWVDDRALAQRMLDPADGVAFVHWTDPAPDLPPGDAVVEAFGCDPPPTFVQAMAARAEPPVWINLEYLSAEDYVARSHGLPSPQWAGPGRGLVKRFFYPGFTAGTGGLLREEGLLQRRQAFDRAAWLAPFGPLPDGTRVIGLLGYPQAPLPEFLHNLSLQPHPTWLLVAHGPLQAVAAQWLREHPSHARWLRVTALPWLSAADFDHLLWSADLNLVRGEDSLVRAIWAGSPFLWQLYPQADGAHAAKLRAFMKQFDPQGRMHEVQPWWEAWNGLRPWPGPAHMAPWCQGPAWDAWQEVAQQARQDLLRQQSLTAQLLDFVQAQRSAGAVAP